MEQIFERVAGLDVHRDSVSACARVPGVRREVVTHKARYATTTAGLAELAGWLGSEAVTVVGMEATGVYWAKSTGRRNTPMKEATRWVCWAAAVGDPGDAGPDVVAGSAVDGAA